jgi:hypothetical protein
MSWILVAASDNVLIRFFPHWWVSTKLTWAYHMLELLVAGNQELTGIMKRIDKEPHLRTKRCRAALCLISVWAPRHRGMSNRYNMPENSTCDDFLPFCDRPDARLLRLSCGDTCGCMSLDFWCSSDTRQSQPRDFAPVYFFSWTGQSVTVLIIKNQKKQQSE